MEMATDPVCGMKVDPASPKGGSHLHAGVGYFFCSEKCRAKFAAEPEKFLAPRAPAPAAAAGAIYTCPMHPEIRQAGPGSCPICGMALEPLMPSIEEEESPELRDMSRRFLVSLPFAAPLLAVAMSEMIP